MYGYFTCPECGERFMVPADATGALVDCTDCIWSGTCTGVEDAPEHPDFGRPLTPADMNHVYFGVPITPIGEEGEYIVALGHVGMVEFMKAASALLEEQGSRPLEYVDQLDKHIHHRWAVNLPECTYEGVSECPHGECVPAEEWTWYIRWSDQETLGSFPVTVSAGPRS